MGVEQHLDRSDDQERAEHRQQPLELVDERGAEADQQRPHDEHADNAPEEHSMLQLGRDREEAEDQRYHEDIVEAE